MSHKLPLYTDVKDVFDDGTSPAWCFADVLAAPKGTPIQTPFDDDDDDDDDSWMLERMYPALAHRARLLRIVPGVVLNQCSSDRVWYADDDICMRRVTVLVRAASDRALDKVRLLKSVPGVVVLIRRVPSKKAAWTFARKARALGVTCRMFIVD